MWGKSGWPCWRLYSIPPSRGRESYLMNNNGRDLEKGKRLFLAEVLFKEMLT